MVAVIRVRARGEWLVLPGRSADATLIHPDFEAIRATVSSAVEAWRPSSLVECGEQTVLCLIVLHHCLS
jgi:hypothetical protein